MQLMLEDLELVTVEVALMDDDVDDNKETFFDPQSADYLFHTANFASLQFASE